MKFRGFPSRSGGKVSIVGCARRADDYEGGGHQYGGRSSRSCDAARRSWQLGLRLEAVEWTPLSHELFNQREGLHGAGRPPALRYSRILVGSSFSGKPTSPGWGPERMGRAWAELMERLGYTGYVAQGGDWGAFVVDQMGLQAPAGLLAIHSNMPATVPADIDKASLAGEPPPSGLSADERRAYGQLIRTYAQVEYARMMAARPQTLYGIADSPVGLAAWLLDHNDADGQPAAAVAAALDRATSATGELTRDEVLDNITLYWLTNTGVSASRLYWEYKGGFFNAKGVSIPVAVTVFPGEQYQAPRSWAEQAYPNLIYFNEVDKGGHFAAWEEPELFSDEVRAAFRSLRTNGGHS